MSDLEQLELEQQFKEQTLKCSEIKKRMKTPKRQSQEESRQELVPKDFSFTVKMRHNVLNGFLRDLEQAYPDIMLRTEQYSDHRVIKFDNSLLNALPYKGIVEFGIHTMWVTDHHKSDIYYFSFHNKEKYQILMQELHARYLASLPPQPVEAINLYRFASNTGTWVSHGSCTDHSKFGLIGYTHFLDQIKHEISVHMKNMSLLMSIGESRSLNYALQGPPGVGKTTMIKSLASQLKLPVCIVNPTEIKSNLISMVLNPTIPNYNRKEIPLLVVFEDFDRFLKGNIDNGNSVMSQILNSLDGFEDKSNVIRFFTANDPDIISQCEALANRMSRTLTFTYPTIDDFRAKFAFLEKHLTPSVTDHIKKEQFFALIQTIPKLTLRPFTTYVVRYMLQPDYSTECSDYMDLMLSNIEQLSAKPLPDISILGSNT
jgi:hypothetical protein